MNKQAFISGVCTKVAEIAFEDEMEKIAAGKSMVLPLLGIGAAGATGAAYAANPEKFKETVKEKAKSVNTWLEKALSKSEIGGSIRRVLYGRGGKIPEKIPSGLTRYALPENKKVKEDIEWRLSDTRKIPKGMEWRTALPLNTFEDYRRDAKHKFSLLPKKPMSEEEKNKIYDAIKNYFGAEQYLNYFNK